jgi:hypothetical protein
LGEVSRRGTISKRLARNQGFMASTLETMHSAKTLYDGITREVVDVNYGAECSRETNWEAVLENQRFLPNDRELEHAAGNAV